MYIIYKTTNLINGKYYIGIHRLDAKQSHKEYFGSGKLITAALKKYGRNNFLRETLFTFNDLETALQKEREIVNEDYIKDESNYNLTVGGNMPPNAKYWWTEEHSKKARLRLLNNTHKLGVKESEESRRKKSISMKNSSTQGRWKRTKQHCEQIAERAKKQMLENNPMKSEFLREKVKLTKIGRKKMINSEGVQKYVRPEEFERYLNDGFVFKSLISQHMNYTINAIDNP